MRLLFAEFRAIAKSALSYAPFVAANSILQDATTKQSLLDRLDALKDDYLIALEHDDVMATGGIVGTRIALDHLNREIDLAAGVIADERAIFNALPLASQLLPPLEIQGWVLSPDSTALGSEVEVHYRYISSDPWHKLSPVDDVRVIAGIQFSLVLPLALGASKIVKRVLILAKQV
jgi:hypothetical protein